MSRSAIDDVQLTQLGGFALSVHGERVCLPLGAQRLLAYLALREGSTPRATAAEALWPHRRGGRAVANLRSALWQVRSLGGIDLIDCVDGRIRLSPSVRVELREVLRWAHELTGAPSPARHLADRNENDAALARELLPDWADDWLMFEREHWDQVRLHVLEILAHRLLAAERYLPALRAALTAVAIEPIRESANRTVMEVHIAEGNLACAIKHYQRYRGLLEREMGVAPSPQMARLLPTPLSR